jgi:spermidine synthase
MPTSNPETTSPAAASSASKKRYAIDVRLFLATITSAMICAFAVGVALGPSYSTPPNEWHVTTPLPEEPHAPYEPSGQHLLIDIKNVESAFLDSEERLADAMVKAVQAGGLTMLSYHCHKLIPSGVSCVGVLMESHISFHTWPDDGVITLDLFTCGPNLLLPVIPKVEELFAVGNGVDDTITRWSHELRGFRSPNNKNRTDYYLDNVSDLNYWILSPLETFSKKQIVSLKSEYQQIDIWDLVEVDDTPSYEDATKLGLLEGDPRWMTPDVVTPDRILFLDGTLQSLTSTEREYHEALVHPAMFAHPAPKYVALVGGGEGATVREVLKHKTVESVTMIELDQMLVNISRQYLPQMSNCSDLVDRNDNCFDDELVEVVYSDAKTWFLDKFGENVASPVQPRFDVVILDALDPEDNVVLAGDLYSDSSFLDALLRSLTEKGVLIVQVGTAPYIHDPRPDMGVYAQREQLFNLFEEHDLTKAMFVYEESHCGFLEPHSFLVVCKSADCRERWMQESDVIDSQIYQRIVLTKSGKPALIHYDGSTQHSYRYPPKAWETVYCRREPTPFECNFIQLDPAAEVHEYNITHEKSGSFKVDWVGDNEEEARIVTTRNIPKGSYIMPSHLASSFQITKPSLENLINITQTVPDAKIIKDWVAYIDKHGHNSSEEGLGKRYVEIGATLFIRQAANAKEANIARWMPLRKRPVYSPVYDRHHLSFDLFLMATRDIKKGEEVRRFDVWEESSVF